VRRLVSVLAVVAGVLAIAVPTAFADVTVTITVAAADGQQPRVDAPLTISGQVSGASDQVMVALSRQEPGDASPQSVGMPQSTDADGNYSFTDAPDRRGSVAYTVTVQPSGPSASATTDVRGLTADLRLTAADHVVPSGHSVDLTVHLASPTDDRHVTLDAKPYHRDRAQVAAGEVDAGTGELTAAYTVDRRTRFFAHFAGDDRYEPASDKLLIRARAVLVERLRGGYADKDGYRLYHPDRDPALAVRLLPSRRACVYFRAQRKDNGRWRNAAVSDCVHTTSDGLARGVFKGYGHHVVGPPYRLRAETHRTKVALAGRGPWLRLKFHR
jgi:hypothetical protein